MPTDEQQDEASELRRIVAERDAEIERLRKALAERDEHARDCEVCRNCKSVVVESHS